jgi:hypothetical protein
MISLDTVIKQVFPQITTTPKGLVKGHIVDGELWLSWEEVRPDGSYEDAITWKFVHA